MNTAARIIGAVILVGTLSTAGCGSASDEGTSGTSSPAGDQSRPPGGPGGFDQSQLTQIRDCLEAAGLENRLDDLPSGVPSDLSSDFPSDFPSERPSDAPSGGPGRQGGGIGGLLSDPDVQNALDACGIELPQPGQPG